MVKSVKDGEGKYPNDIIPISTKYVLKNIERATPSKLLNLLDKITTPNQYFMTQP